MKITDLNGVNGSGKPKKPKKTGDKGAFDALLGETEETGESQESGSAAPTNSVDAASALLSLQEVQGEAGLRQQTIKHGSQSLDILEELRRDLLLGGDNATTLQRMKDQQTRLNQQAHDPMLKHVIDDIDLRLAVEIAKRENAFA